jgi:hypothetical protein
MKKIQIAYSIEPPLLKEVVDTRENHQSRNNRMSELIRLGLMTEKDYPLIRDYVKDHS